jgi:hypothetical protein
LNDSTTLPQRGNPDFQARKTCAGRDTEPAAHAAREMGLIGKAAGLSRLSQTCVV